MPKDHDSVTVHIRTRPLHSSERRGGACCVKLDDSTVGLLSPPVQNHELYMCSNRASRVEGRRCTTPTLSRPDNKTPTRRSRTPKATHSLSSESSSNKQPVVRDDGPVRRPAQNTFAFD